jgi:putative membrane protein
LSEPAAIVDRLEKAVLAIEAASSAEVLVSIVPKSGSYGDVDLLWGWLLGLTTLGIILWSPWSFHPDFILLNVLLSSFLGWIASRHWSAMRRLLTTRKRRLAQLDAAARLDFLARRGDTTRDRTGILVFVSRLERGIALVPDRGVSEALPADILSGWRDTGQAPRDLAHLISSLQQLLGGMAAPLAEHLPRREDDIDELENRPHVVAR